MKHFLIFLFGLLFYSYNAIADDKVYTLARTSDYGIVVDDNKWTVKQGIVTANYHTRDLSAIRGESVTYPMDFEFFSLFIPPTFSYAKRYLEIYAFNTKTVFYFSRFTREKCFVQVEGTYFDNISNGYFAFTIHPDRKFNGRAFAMMAKLRLDLGEEEETKELFAEVGSMITPLVN